MNIFRLLGDVSHLLAIIILLLKIWKTRSCAGISGKSQALFLIVFISRYLDLVTNFVSVYNTVMKVFFIVSAAGTVYLMFVKFKATYDGNHDTFRVEFLLELNKHQIDCTSCTCNEEDLHSCIVNTDKVCDQVKISGGEHKEEQHLALARDTCTRACL